MIIKKEFSKSDFYNFRFSNIDDIYVIKIPYDDFKVKTVPSYIEIDENDLIFATIICIMNDALMNYLLINMNEYSLFEMTTPFSNIECSDKEAFFMFNCDQTDVALISKSEKENLSNYNAKKYGAVFLVTKNEDLFLRIKLYL